MSSHSLPSFCIHQNQFKHITFLIVFLSKFCPSALKNLNEGNNLLQSYQSKQNQFVIQWFTKKYAHKWKVKIREKNSPTISAKLKRKGRVRQKGSYFPLKIFNGFLPEFYMMQNLREMMRFSRLAGASDILGNLL